MESLDPKQLVVRVGNVIINHMTLVVLAALIPLVLAIAGSFLSAVDDHPRVAVIGIGSLWSITMLSFAKWFYEDRKRRRQRMLDFGKAMFASDFAMQEWMRSNNVESPSQTIVANLLRSMCSLVADRININRKGATFLALGRDEAPNGFKLYAQFNHDLFPEMSKEIENLNREKGLAGQAVRLRRIIWVKDCTKPPLSVEWVDTHTPTRFRMRAAVPVTLVSSGSTEDVGAVCFDIDHPFALTKEDEQVLQVFADKIGRVYELLEPDRAKQGSKST